MLRNQYFEKNWGPLNSNVVLFMDNPLNCLANELELGRPFKKILSFEVYNGPFNKIEVLKEFETGISGHWKLVF